MSIHKSFFVFAAVLSLLLPAAAAECTTDLDKTSCSDQVKLAISPARALLDRSRIDAIATTPFALAPGEPSKMLPESATFSEEGSVMRWLYSSVAEKRIFAMYTGPQRGRPAELRVTVRLSIL